MAMVVRIVPAETSKTVEVFSGAKVRITCRLMRASEPDVLLGLLLGVGDQDDAGEDIACRLWLLACRNRWLALGSGHFVNRCPSGTIFHIRSRSLLKDRRAV